MSTSLGPFVPHPVSSGHQPDLQARPCGCSASPGAGGGVCLLLFISTIFCILAIPGVCCSLLRSHHSAARQNPPTHPPGQGSQRSQSPATLVKRKAGPDEHPGPRPQVRTTSRLLTPDHVRPLHLFRPRWGDPCSLSPLPEVHSVPIVVQPAGELTGGPFAPWPAQLGGHPLNTHI